MEVVYICEGGKGMYIIYDFDGWYGVCIKEDNNFLRQSEWHMFSQGSYAIWLEKSYQHQMSLFLY